MDYDSARKNMIEQHIRPWNVNSSDVINSLYSVPRENFVPDAYKNFAFCDFQVPLGDNESMFNPMIEARILQSSLTRAAGEILEIGCGHGYMAALLSQIYKSVITVEINQSFVIQAEKNFKSQNIKNVQILHGDGLKVDSRWSNKKFDAIVISGGIKTIPFFLKNSISKNGKIVAMIGDGPAMDVVILKKNNISGFIKSVLFQTEVGHLNQFGPSEFFQF